MPRLPPALRTPVLAVLVAVGYYAGSLLGFRLRLPPATTSLLWPPNAFLTAVLLLSPPRRFGLWLMAALPAHVLIQVQAGFPPLLIAGLFVTNCLEALVAASISHRFSDAPTRLDTLDRVTVFVFGSVLVAPFLSSFADAAVVHGLRGEDYETVWLRREFSNTLSQLAIVPGLLAASRGVSWLRGAPRRRRFETALLALALVGLGLLVFTDALQDSTVLPGGPETGLPLLVPLLVLAAVRFGAGGASLSILTLALLAIGTALAGFPPHLSVPVEERMRGLQTFLIVVGVPLLVLGALIEERRQSALSLRERLRFEEFLSQLSAALAHTPAEEMAGVFDAWLERIGRMLGVSRVALWELSARGDALVVVGRWSDPPDARAPSILPRRLYPWSAHRVLSLHSFVWPDPADLPEEAAPEREILRAAGVRSLVTLPLLAGGEAFGSLALVDTRERRTWPPLLVQRGHLMADVFAGALARRRAVSGIEQARQELAHALRVSTIGELTTSLAHELNQPLAAIVANAQAARRMLAGPTTPPELREIVEELVQEGRRAGDVIQRLRELLRKGEVTREEVDLNELVADVAKLAANEVMIRGVSLRLDLARRPLRIRGDRVQLRQVLLNLLMNALEALADAGEERRVVARTEELREGLARATIEDSGPGLGSADASDVFRPFYTTKAKGMGMGLSIARSIVEAHGGRITASNNDAGGASVGFTLPLVEEPREG